MLYRCSSRFGEFRLVRERTTWSVEFNGVPIAEGFASAEDALSNLVRPSRFSASLAELLHAAGLPRSTDGWEHTPPPAHGRGGAAASTTR